MSTQEESKAEPNSASFRSKLAEGRQRFLAHVIEHGFAIGQRGPQDFIRHFPPDAIMEGLKNEPERRANIMVICTGTRMKIALKKPYESCAEDLQIALEEDECDAETVVTLFDPDDRVRFLDSQRLWTYIVEGDFWTDPKKNPHASAHLAFILERGLTDGLLSHKEVVEGISTEQMVDKLPRAELAKIIQGALTAGQAGKPFSETNMLAMVPPSALVHHIPLTEIWDRVVVAKIAERHKFVEARSEGPDTGEMQRPPADDDDDDGEDLDMDMDIDDVIDGLGAEDETADSKGGESTAPADA